MILSNLHLFFYFSAPLSDILSVLQSKRIFYQFEKNLFITLLLLFQQTIINYYKSFVLKMFDFVQFLCLKINDNFKAIDSDQQSLKSCKSLVLLQQKDMNQSISDKMRDFIGGIKSHLQSKNIAIAGLFQVLKLENPCSINQEVLIKIIEAANLEKSAFNPFKMNDQFRKLGTNFNIQKFKQLYQSQIKDLSPIKKQVKKVQIQLPKTIVEKTVDIVKNIQLQKRKIQQNVFKTVQISQAKKIQIPQIKNKEKKMAQSTKKDNTEKESNQSIFDDQTPQYVIKQIKAMIAADGRTLPNLFKQSSLQNTIFIRKDDAKKLISCMKIQCLRNETLVESLTKIIMKKQRMSKYQIQVFFDEYGMNKKVDYQEKQKNAVPLKTFNKVQTKIEVKNQQKSKVKKQIIKEQKKEIATQVQQKKALQQKVKEVQIAIQTPSILQKAIKYQKKQQIEIQTGKQIIDTKQPIKIQKKQTKPTIIQKKPDYIITNKVSLDSTQKIKANISIKQMQIKNRETSQKRVDNSLKGKQLLRKNFSSQQKRTELVRNKLQSKQQTSKPNNSQFLLASHYFRLNSHSSEQEKSCMTKLEQVLKFKKLYVDENNPIPISKNHIYAPIDTVFPQKQYVVVCKSASQPITHQIISSKNVIQGQVGNCYFVSVLATLAELHPKKISQLLLFQSNPSNYLAVKLFIDGQWKIIETDNRFVCQDGRLSCSKSFKNEIWAMLIQKCFAKVYGGYNEIESGSPSESFFVLTGAPCQQFNYKNDKVQVGQLVKILKNHIAEGYLMGASVDDAVQNQTRQSLQKNKGLIMDHAYSLLDIVEVNNKLYVRLRNPWSNVIWKGDWSQISKSFSKQTKSKLNCDIEQKNGIFFMEWKYFYRYFSYVSICRINPEFYHTTMRLTFNKRKSNYIKMTVQKQGSYNIFICQQFARKYKKKDPKFESSDARLIIMKRDEKGQLSYIASKNSLKAQVCCQDVYLQIGVYILSTKVIWKNWTDHEASLVSYGVGKVSFELITNRKIVPSFKSSLIDDYICQNKANQKSHVCLGQGKSCVTQYRHFNVGEAIGYMRIVSNMEKAYKFKYVFKLQGMKVIKPNENTVIFELKPKQQQRVGFFLGASHFNFNYSIDLL